MKSTGYVLGIDIGTSGAKALIVDQVGRVGARGVATLKKPEVHGLQREQDAEAWWEAVVWAIRQALAELKASGASSSAVEALTVDATSGTVVPVDANLCPLRPGLMYNDGRATEQALRLNDFGRKVIDQLGYRFNASFALAKILWLIEHETEITDRTVWFLHQADLILNRLMQTNTPISDESNALKTGYDIIDRSWPEYLEQTGIDVEKLPRVRPIGTTMGTIGKRIAQDFGLSDSCKIISGMSDGTAACAASGARHIGDMSTTLGTTIVWKALSGKPICDPAGRLYSHRHPSGNFLPGGAGNSGGGGIRETLQTVFGDTDLDALANECHQPEITPFLTYPLPMNGERYPFVDSSFVPFSTFSGDDPIALYRSCLEGVSFIEKWGFEIISELGGECTGEVWTAGSGAHVEPWMRIRANVIGKPVCRAESPESGFGAAMAAAMNVWYDGNWTATADAMIHEAGRFDPQPNVQGLYQEKYEQFRSECARRISLRP
ncbi:MAG: FGGY-family carbohydrate kinase [Rhodospirillales bacterium]|jgi:xylulokinase|nr:FGGY-family carbohydrate kinase [Nitrospinaceae bacterium]MDP7624424.1 FGGY-family carbohydrate kinase [Rhodospirillales bacterium]